MTIEKGGEIVTDTEYKLSPTKYKMENEKSEQYSETSIFNDFDYKDYRCAPSKKFESGSCIPFNVLLEMAKVYNQEFPNSKIKMRDELLNNQTRYKNYLLKQFSKRLSDVCDDQSCWVKQSFINKLNSAIKNDLKHNTFRPSGPQGRFEWLNTININDVMKQYEKMYTDYKFLGAVPIDFDELSSLNIKNLDFKKLYSEGIKRIGIIFNLDEHYKSGSHWVAGYVDLEKGDVHYFDSYGIEPDERINAFLKRAETFIQTGLGKQINRLDNKTKHQRKNSECGVYSLNFILRLLKGESFDKITSTRLSDEQVNECRKTYFVNPKF